MVHLPDIVVMLILTDGDEKISAVNPEVSRQMGYRPEDLIGASIGKYLTPESRTRMLARLQFRGTAGGIEKLPIEIQCLDGSVMAVRVSTKQYFDDMGKQTGALATLINVTQGQQAELESVLIASELAQAHRSLGEFSRVVATQLSEPFSMFESFAGMIDHNARLLLATAGQQQLDDLQEQIKQFGEVLARVAALATVDTSDTGLHVVDLAVLVKHCVEGLRSKIEECQAAVIVEGDLSVVTIRSPQLDLVIHHLLDNAMRYRSPSRVLAIHLVCKRVGGQVEISVTDNGLGFDQKNCELIFESFKRDVRSDRLEKRGVGLAICRRIMAQADGAIHATSANGYGSTFILRFKDHSSI